MKPKIVSNSRIDTCDDCELERDECQCSLEDDVLKEDFEEEE